MKVPWQGLTKIGLSAGVVTVGLSMFATQAAFALGTVGTATPEVGGTALSGAQASTQAFGLTLSPTGSNPAMCSGSTTGNGTQVQSYFVPSTTPPSSITYSGGNINGAANNPLLDSGGNAVVPGNTSSTGGVINVSNSIEFGGANGFGSSTVLANGGMWNAGIACTVPNGTNPATVSDYWNTVCTFLASTSDSGGFTWSCSSGSTGIVPEAPLAVGLPLGGAAVIGAGVFINRRRRRPARGAPTAA